MTEEFGKVCIMVTCMQYFFFIWHRMGTLQKKSYEPTFLCNFTNYWLPGVVI